MAGQLFNFTTTISFQQAGNTAISGSVSFADNTVTYFGQLIPANSSALAYTFEFFYSTLQQLVIAAGNQGPVTVEFLNASSNEGTFVLAAGQCVQWNVDDLAANATQFPAPFAANITSIKVTTTAASNLFIAVVNAN